MCLTYAVWDYFILRRFLFASMGKPNGGRERKYHPQGRTVETGKTKETSTMKKALACTLSLALLLSLAACGKPQSEQPDASQPGAGQSSTGQSSTGQPDPAAGSAAQSDPDLPPEEPRTADRPTIPENLAEGMDYLYDFTFTERYDDRRTADFSLILPENVQLLSSGHAVELYEKYQNEAVPDYTTVLDGDGMAPHLYKRYWYSCGAGQEMFVETDFYEPDNVEYVSCIYSNIGGVATNQGVAVGSPESELLSAYRENLYYISKGETEPRIAAVEDGVPFRSVFEYAYAWQPYTPETNECRDVTFYINDGKIVSIETISPFALRYVYGYDRETGRQTADERRAALNLSN